MMRWQRYTDLGEDNTEQRLWGWKAFGLFLREQGHYNWSTESKAKGEEDEVDKIKSCKVL